MSMLPKDALRRILVSLIADEVGRARGRAVAPSEWTRWGDATVLDEDNVGVDSVDRLGVIARVSGFFGLPRIGSEDYLVVSPTLGEWVDLVDQSLDEMIRRELALEFEFQTSGSTGAPQRIVHSVDRLVAEVDAFAEVIADVRRVWSFTPPHHIYGFIHGVLAPARRATPAVDARALGPSALSRLRAGDLAIATPHQWSQLLGAVARVDEDVRGVSSGAPTPPAVFAAARARGVARLLDVYGSTETAGVGWRDAPDAAFELLPIWTPEDDGLRACGVGAAPRRAPETTLDVTEAPAAEPARAAPPDHLDWIDARRFRPAGRLDKAVQVAGVNVSLDLVRSVLLAHEFVSDCAVRVDEADAARRLKAFVVPAIAAPEATQICDAVLAHVRDKLPAPARPKRVTVGDALPRSATGKLVDWRVEPSV